MTTLDQTISNQSACSEKLNFSERAAHTNRRFLADRIATRVVALGGWLILLAICAIMLVILVEVLPLFKSPKISQGAVYQLDQNQAAQIIPDNHLEQALIINSDISASLLQIDGQLSQTALKFENTNNQQILNIISNSNQYFLGTNLGQVLTLNAQFTDEFSNSKRSSKLVANFGKIYDLTPNQPIKKLAVGTKSNGQLFVAYTGDSVLKLLQLKAGMGLMRTAEPTLETTIFDTQLSSEISALVMDARAEYLSVGTQTGEIILYSLQNLAQIVELGRYKIEGAVTDLKYLQGERTLISATSSGVIQSWQVLKNSQGAAELRQIYKFSQHQAGVIGIVPAQRNRVFLSYDELNNIKVHYGSNGRTLKSFNANLNDQQKIAQLNFSPKGNGIWALTSNNKITFWTIDNPHPEVSWRSLFAPVQYEGYQSKEYVWQSTGGTDVFESKFSLVPLIFGTIKGAFYALLFALPLAFLSALYTALFMTPRLKAIVKPVLETMAALPSVVIGFVAGLWLAPIIEPHLLSVILAPLVFLMIVVLGCLLNWFIQHKLQIKFGKANELFFSVLLIIIGFFITVAVSGAIENLFFAGNLKSWLYEIFKINIDQRNSIVAGIAVGFAVVPIIFTISEDCLTSVPRALTAGSLALGATRWQTAIRVVLPVAAPGIFAAVMIGIGRAVGETMIVLMATGNTPILNLSAFNGFRALSANIAVELPEAPVGSTLYRLLFLTALILFLMTFALNIISEFVRSRLKKRLAGVG